MTNFSSVNSSLRQSWGTFNVDHYVSASVDVRKDSLPHSLSLSKSRCSNTDVLLLLFPLNCAKATGGGGGGGPSFRRPQSRLIVVQPLREVAARPRLPQRRLLWLACTRLDTETSPLSHWDVSRGSWKGYSVNEKAINCVTLKEQI